MRSYCTVFSDLIHFSKSIKHIVAWKRYFFLTTFNWLYIIFISYNGVLKSSLASLTMKTVLLVTISIWWISKKVDKGNFQKFRHTEVCKVIFCKHEYICICWMISILDRLFICKAFQLAMKSGKSWSYNLICTDCRMHHSIK